MFEWITYTFIGLVVVIFISIVIVRKRQSKRLKEARIRGKKQALRELKQYDALRKLEGSEIDRSKEVGEYSSRRGRRGIKR